MAKNAIVWNVSRQRKTFDCIILTIPAALQRAAGFFCTARLEDMVLPEVRRDVLQMRQYARLPGSGQQFIIPYTVQTALCDGDILMPHQPRKAV